MLNDWVNQTYGCSLDAISWTNINGAAWCDALQVAVRSLTQGIRSDNDEAQKAAAEQIIRIAKPWTIRRWSESKLADGEPLGQWIQSWSEIDDLSEPPLFRWLREDFIPMLVRQPAEYPPAELEKDLEAEEFVRLTLLLRKRSYFVLSLAKSDIFNGGSSSILATMSISSGYSRNPSVFITTPKVVAQA
ncbi:hypothetical protein BDD12DRAFT_811084 [Trichophaea hybrida]|nr:hypothetical protein BDD12DRAFT_811084 [Trichophaea hybrida]